MNVNKARDLRKDLTKAEQALWKHLRMRQLGGYKFRRQKPIGAYILDFVSFEKRLIIEVDGGQHSQQVDYDAERTTWLEAQGYRVLRFWNNQVLEEVEGVKAVILKVLESERIPPTLILPHKGGGEAVPSPLAGEGQDGG